MSAMDDQELVDTLDEVWRSIDALGATLTEAEWKAPSELPGWSVQDNVVHLSSIESMLLGRPWKGLDAAPEAEHVKNDMGADNEKAVHSRRSWSGADALAEFHALTRERIERLRALDTAGFDADSWTPQGPGTVRTLLPFRIFDSYAHEQDMRRALDRPGGTDTRAAAQAVEMGIGAMPFVVGKKAGAPDGSTVVFSIAAPLADDVAIEVVDGRARRCDPGVDAPTVRLAMSAATFERLGSGRISGAACLERGDVVLDGDDELGRRVLASMNYLF
ncbi:MAG TPA: maleylpyruvate isomerase family mycothiol-dependent enzyme [Acidimicrobiia bacterium]|nr:maleylpyruvate isomerase family mycothiol-dependent enzyme [Acidimicrobiia bacterium]